jgi:glycine cleavage system regulatory protein
MSEAIAVTLPGRLVTEISPLLQQNDLDLETFVCRVLQTYVTMSRQHRIQVRLARDYDELATMYNELATELADEVWLPLENQALLHTERDMAA